MTERFNLRFESGERRGESVPVPRSGLLLGRRDGNDLVIVDPSVSGRHALVRPDDDALAVEDLGSTNGTLIDGTKIERGRVAPGQVLRIGKVELSVIDNESPAAAAGVPAGAAGSGEIDLEIDIDLGAGAGAGQGTPAADSSPLLEDEIDLGGSPAIPAVSAVEPPEPASIPAAAPAAPAPAASAPAAPGSAAAPTAAPAPQSSVPDATQPPTTSAGELHEIDESALERSRRSPLMTVAVVLMLLGGVAVAAVLMLDLGGGSADGPSGAAPLAIANNLIEGGDLEGVDAEALLESEGGGGRFLADRVYASTGQAGLGFVARGGATVRAGSPPVRALAGRTLAASASILVTESATARVGLEISDSTGTKTPFSVWSAAPVADTDQRLEARAAVPAGYDRARLLILAGDGGSGSTADEDADVGEVAVDDLAIVVTTEPAAAEVAVGDFIVAVNEPGHAEFRLQYIAEVMLIGRVGSGDGPLASGSTLKAVADGEGRVRIDIATAGAGNGGGLLLLDARSELIGEDGRALATTGADGYRARSGEFESNGVDALLLGAGARLTRILFDGPVDVRGRERAGRQALEIDLRGAGGFTLQLSFQSELEDATNLATRARAAQRDGRLGDVLALWGELLREFPFEEGLVAEADAARAEIIGRGLTELGTVEQEVERARFFALAGIYADCERDIQTVADRYRPTEGGEASEVFERAEALLATIRSERSALDVQAAGSEPDRKRAILGWLERNEAARLAARVRETVDG